MFTIYIGVYGYFNKCIIHCTSKETKSLNISISDSKNTLFNIM